MPAGACRALVFALSLFAVLSCVWMASSAFGAGTFRSLASFRSITVFAAFRGALIGAARIRPCARFSFFCQSGSLGLRGGRFPAANLAASGLVSLGWAWMPSCLAPAVVGHWCRFGGWCLLSSRLFAASRVPPDVVVCLFVVLTRLSCVAPLLSFSWFSCLSEALWVFVQGVLARAAPWRYYCPWPPF